VDTTPILEKLRELREEKALGVRFLNEKGAARITYAELIDRSRIFAASLQGRGVRPGEPVILVLTIPENAIVAILGCMIAGCPPTPVYPPASLQAVPNFQNFLKHVIQKSGAGFLVADAQPYRLLGFSLVSSRLKGIERFDRMFGAERLDFGTHNEAIAFLQFTSGSTALPKGVIVTHEGLAANLWMIRTCVHMNSRSCVVTWLPVYHDMGLIGTVLNAITLSCELVVLSPLVFLKRPRIWLQAISDFRGTHTAAPNFAYGLCVKRVPDVSGLDLSSMTTFICGAEPVLPSSMEKFANHYETAKLDPCSLVPAYGLAEATLAVTFNPYLRGLITDEVDVDLLSKGKAVHAQNAAHRVKLASCGVPMPGLSLRIADETGRSKSEREVGEIQLQGPTITPGYIQDEDATHESRTADGWFRTGDLGYLANGELYVCGRIKDVIIIRGKNYYAHDIESIASEVKGVRVGNVVAFGIQKEAGESLIIVAESREEGTEGISRGIRVRVTERTGISADDVVIVAAGTLPKTSSGKLKRIETRRLYEEGKLEKGKLQELQSALQSGFSYIKGRLGI